MNKESLNYYYQGYTRCIEVARGLAKDNPERVEYWLETARSWAKAYDAELKKLGGEQKIKEEYYLTMGE